MGKDYHAKGQQDYASGKDYEPPHGLLEDVLTWSRDGCRKIAEDNSAYRAGWSHAKSQDK